MTACLGAACDGEHHDPLDAGTTAHASRLPDAVVSDASGGPEQDAGSSCSDLQIEGGSVRATRIDGPAPAMTGGTIADGSYDLVEVRAYDIDLSTFSARAYRFEGDRFAFALEGSNHRSGRYSTSGTTLTFHRECPRTEDVSVEYSASGDRLELVELVGGGGFTAVKVFQRR